MVKTGTATTSKKTTASKAAKPGTQDPKGAKEKPKKVPYPGLKPDEKGKATVKLETWPDDFDPKLHKPLRRGDMKDESVWLLRKAEEHDKKAADLRKEAEIVKTTGGKQSAKKAQRFAKMTSRLAELRKELEADGLDVEGLLESLNEEDDE